MVINVKKGYSHGLGSTLGSFFYKNNKKDHMPLIFNEIEFLLCNQIQNIE